MLIAMNELCDLRKILSGNIKKARAEMRITQVKLAVYSDISVPHMIEIEQCKTWVSDRTLTNIAKALNMEVYELLIPQTIENPEKVIQKKNPSRQITELINLKKNQLHKITDETMDDLIMEIINLP